MRDSQRQKLYDAEQDAFRWNYGEIDKRFDVGGVEGAQALVNAVFASEEIRMKFSCLVPTPEVVRGHGKRGRGCYKHRLNEIHLPPPTQLKWYVLHECAHALQPSNHLLERAAHGREFAACYLYLIRVYMGRGWEEALKTQFKAHRVSFKPKRAYTISDAERQRRAERAAKLRAA